MASGNSREKGSRRSSPAPDGGTGLNHYASLIGTTQGRPAHDQWAKSRNLGHYKSLFACVDRTFGKFHRAGTSRKKINARLSSKALAFSKRQTEARRPNRIVRRD